MRIRKNCDGCGSCCVGANVIVMVGCVIAGEEREGWWRKVVRGLQREGIDMVRGRACSRRG